MATAAYNLQLLARRAGHQPEPEGSPARSPTTTAEAHAANQTAFFNSLDRL